MGRETVGGGCVETTPGKRGTACNISGNSQAIPELFLAQDQVAGYLLKVIVEP